MLDKYDKNKNPFKVPDNYFEGLTQDIMKNLPAKENKQVKKIHLWKKILPYAGIAALIAMIAISVSLLDYSPSFLSQNNGENNQQVETWDQHVAYNEVEDYLLFLEDEAGESEYIDMIFEE